MCFYYQGLEDLHIGMQRRFCILSRSWLASLWLPLTPFFVSMSTVQRDAQAMPSFWYHSCPAWLAEQQYSRGLLLLQCCSSQFLSPAQGIGRDQGHARGCFRLPRAGGCLKDTGIQGHNRCHPGIYMWMQGPRQDGQMRLGALRTQACKYKTDGKQGVARMQGGCA